MNGRNTLDFHPELLQAQDSQKMGTGNRTTNQVFPEILSTKCLFLSYCYLIQVHKTHLRLFLITFMGVAEAYIAATGCRNQPWITHPEFTGCTSHSFTHSLLRAPSLQ